LHFFIRKNVKNIKTLKPLFRVKNKKKTFLPREAMQARCIKVAERLKQDLDKDFKTI